MAPLLNSDTLSSASRPRCVTGIGGPSVVNIQASQPLDEQALCFSTNQLEQQGSLLWFAMCLPIGFGALFMLVLSLRKRHWLSTDNDHLIEVNEKCPVYLEDVKSKPLEYGITEAPRPEMKKRKPMIKKPSDNPYEIRVRELNEHTKRYPREAIDPQPMTIPITSEELAAEAHGILAGLLMLEAKAANFYHENPQDTLIFNNDQWRAIIKFHYQLLSEHYNFFSATQHPKADQALRNLAIRQSMETRLWRVSILNCIEMLIRGLPESHEFLDAFICMSYDFMLTFYETVPGFQGTWSQILTRLSIYSHTVLFCRERSRLPYSNEGARDWFNYHFTVALRREGFGETLHRGLRPLNILGPSFSSEIIRDLWLQKESAPYYPNVLLHAQRLLSREVGLMLLVQKIREYLHSLVPVDHRRDYFNPQIWERLCAQRAFWLRPPRLFIEPLAATMNRAN